jgi:hypothetical protein
MLDDKYAANIRHPASNIPSNDLLDSADYAADTSGNDLAARRPALFSHGREA